MQILTPTGYRNIADCAVGDEVSAFDIETGAPIVNTIEALQWIDAAEWARWWQVEPTAPPFQFFRINGTWTLNSEQSIWRNGANVCHAKHLVIGDIVYDDADQPITITSVEEVAADGWWRFDISGDHSYIVDGLTLHNASRFWVGGTGTWDSSTTTHWAATTGAAGGQSVPGSADTVTFDGSSGGGTVTVNFGGAITIQSLTMSAFTGTWDNSVNNNNFTLSATGNAFNGSGTSTRTYNMGSATYTLTNAIATFTIQNATGLTLSAASAVISFTGTSGLSQFVPAVSGGPLTFGTVSFAARSVAGVSSIVNTVTIGTLNITAPNYLQINGTVTVTVSNAFSWVGSSSSQIGIISATSGSTATIAAAAGSAASWTSFRDITFTGSPTITDSFALGNVNGVTISPPGGSGTTVNRAGVVGG